jgi:hypothetical protein
MSVKYIHDNGQPLWAMTMELLSFKIGETVDECIEAARKRDHALVDILSNRCDMYIAERNKRERAEKRKLRRLQAKL